MVAITNSIDRMAGEDAITMNTTTERAVRRVSRIPNLQKKIKHSEKISILRRPIPVGLRHSSVATRRGHGSASAPRRGADPWRRPFPTRWLVSCAGLGAVEAGLAIWHASGRQSSFQMSGQQFKPWVRDPAHVLPMLNKLKGAALLRYTLRNDGTVSVKPYFGLAKR
jgi:hypothetical protein